MKLRKILMLGLGAIAFSTAYATDTTTTTTNQTAEKKPLNKITCQEFLITAADFQPKMVYWAVGHAQKGTPEHAIVDIQGTEKIVPMVISECQKEPNASFWQKVKTEAKKVI